MLTLAQKALVQEAPKVFMALLALFHGTKTLRHEVVSTVAGEDAVIGIGRSDIFVDGHCRRRIRLRGRLTQLLDACQYVFLMELVLYAHIL